MIFRCIIETSKIPDGCKKITPLYKTLDDDITEEIDWIHLHKDNIINAACEFVWDLYYEAFKEKKILTRNRFYELVKKELSLKNKVVKISQNNTKRCFVEK